MNALVSKVEQQERLPVSMSPQQIVLMAMDKGYDIDRISAMVDIAERLEKAQQEREFNRAVAAFKEKPPVFFADKDNLQYKSKYTSIGNMVNTTNAALGPHGLEASWDFDQSDPKLMKVTCILKHASGFSRQVSLTGPLDTSGAKNPLQQIKSTITYLEIATFQAVTGVATAIGNADDDGNGSSANAPETISEKQIADINALMTEVNANREAFMRYYKINDLADIRVASYDAIVAQLVAKRKKS